MDDTNLSSVVCSLSWVLTYTKLYSVKYGVNTKHESTQNDTISRSNNINPYFEQQMVLCCKLLLNGESPWHTLLQVLHEPRYHVTQTNYKQNNGRNSSKKYIGNRCSKNGYSMMTNLKASVSSCSNALDLLNASSIARVDIISVRSESMAF